MSDNVYKKLQAARVALQGMKLKESGKNTFANYTYMELGDFLPQINALCAEHGLCGVVSFFGDVATLTIVNTESIEDKVVFTSPMSTADLKGCHAIQNLGAVQSYLRRYLYVSAFEIVEHDALDSTTGKEKVETKKEEPKPSETQVKLYMELSDFCGANSEKMANTLKDVSLYTGKDGDKWLYISDIQKANPSDKFQRWVGSALGKLRDKVKEQASA